MHPLGSLDTALYERVAALDVAALDRAMRRLSRTADHGLLWFGAAGALALLGGGPGRRAARRGVASLALSSALANLVGKPLSRRARPVLEHPRPRHVAMPATSSFPSGHAASAFGFAVGAARELPALGPPLLTLAALVAYSRVHTGVHYPADVVAGAALGTGAARLLAGRGRHRGMVDPAPAARPRGRARPLLRSGG